MLLLHAPKEHYYNHFTLPLGQLLCVAEHSMVAYVLCFGFSELQRSPAGGVKQWYVVTLRH